jgi:thymidylate synthase (FAD)
VKVDLLTSPDRETMLPAIAEMLESTHATQATTITDQEAVRDVLKGEGLWGAQEVLPFTLRITGVSRKFTHQLVRARIGVTFFQQCTGDQDLRHCAILVPRAWHQVLREAYVDHALSAKHLYCRAVDNHVPVHEASYLLPHSISTYIYMHASLATLVAFYRKRICTMVNLWEMHLVAKQVASAIVRAYPETFKLFYPSPCQTGACWYQHNKYSKKNTSWWQPDEQHDTFPWVAEDFDYGTHAGASDPLDPFNERLFSGFTEKFPATEEEISKWPS